MSTIILGIDPGAHGAIAVCYQRIVSTEGKPLLVIDKLHGQDAYDILEGHREAARCEGSPIVAYVEKVGGFVPRRGKNGNGEGQPGSSMFKFGEGCGYIRGCLRALGIRTIYVPPQAWQKGYMGLSKAKGAERKRALRAEAQRRFPEEKVTLDNCDALLIMDYGIRQEKGGAS